MFIFGMMYGVMIIDLCFLWNVAYIIDLVIV